MSSPVLFNIHGSNGQTVRWRERDQEALNQCSTGCVEGLAQIVTERPRTEQQKCEALTTFTVAGALFGAPFMPPLGLLVGGFIGGTIGCIKVLVGEIQTEIELRNQRN